MMVWKMIFLFTWVVFRFHVNLPGCTVQNGGRFLMSFFPIAGPLCNLPDATSNSRLLLACSWLGVRRWPR